MKHFWVAIVAVSFALPAFAEEGDPAAALIGQLHQRAEPTERAAIIGRIGEVKPHPRYVIPLLAQRLVIDSHSSAKEIHRPILACLEKFGPDAKPAAGAIAAWCVSNANNHSGVAALQKICPEHADLLKLLGGPREVDRLAGCLLLREAGIVPTDAMPLLLEGLVHHDPIVRADAADMIALFHQEAKPTLPALVKAMDDTDARVRAAAARCVGRMETKLVLRHEPRPGYSLPRRLYHHAPAEGVPALLKSLKDPDLFVRLNAAGAIAHAGPARFPDIVPVLVDGLTSQDRNCCGTTVNLLRDLEQPGPEEIRQMHTVIPALRGLILTRSDNAEDSWIYADAANAVARFAPAREGASILLEAYAAKTVWRPRLIESLSRCGDDPEVVKFLVEAVDDDDPDERAKKDIREAAVLALGRLRPIQETAIDKLLEVLRGKDKDLQWWVLSALEEVGKSDPKILSAVRQFAFTVHDGQWCVKALDLLVKLGPDNATILDLVENLHHSKPFVREQIALALGKSRLFPEQGIPALIRQLKDRNPDVRHAALSALGEYGPAARSAIPALMEAMEVHRGYWHDSPAETLAQIGSDSVPQLLDALKSGREYPAFGPFDALRKLGLQAASAVPELAELLTASNEGMRFKAEILLTEIGPEARLAVPALEKLRTIKERQSRIDRVLIAIGSPAVDTFLRDLDPNKLERSLIAIKALGEMRVRAEKSLPVLNDLARSENRRLRFAAAEAISKIGTRREAAILVAHEMLTDRSPTIRVTGAEILGKFGPQDLSDSTVNMLLLSTKDGDPGVRLAAAQGLSKLGGPARRQALPVLAALVADSRPEFQQIRETAVNLIVAMLDHKER